MAVPKMHNPRYENLCLNTSPADATLKYGNTMLKTLLQAEQTHGLPQGPSENALLPPEVMTKMSWEEQKAVSQGMLQYFVEQRMNLSDPTSVLTLKMLHGAIRSGNLKTIREIDPELASVLSIYRLKPDAFREYYFDFAYDYLQGQIEIALALLKVA